jgi:hypothetical protein
MAYIIDGNYFYVSINVNYNLTWSSTGSLISSCVCSEIKEETDEMSTKPTLAFIVVSANNGVPEAKTSMCNLVGINTVGVKLDEKTSQSDLHYASKYCSTIVAFC